MKQSAGILLYKKVDGEIQVLLGHPGGPFWKNKDSGVWSIPKGEFTEEENALDAAIREFEEETATRLHGDFIALEPVKLKSGKVIFAWALESDLDVASVQSNSCEIEWPPKTGRKISIPEIDRAQWFSIDMALEKINPGQSRLITQLLAKIQ